MRLKRANQLKVIYFETKRYISDIKKILEIKTRKFQGLSKRQFFANEIVLAQK